MPEELLQHIRSKYQDECKGELVDMHLTNFLYNMQIVRNYPGILGFEGIFKKYPAIIVGCGPSLSGEQMELLKEYRDRVIILALDAALPIFEKAGFYPHFACMVDPTQKQVDNFKNIDTTKFYSIIPPIVHPSIFRAIDPKHVAVYNIKDPNSTVMEQAPYHTGRKGALPAGVLTSGACFSFASIMGCDPIMFIGHDLCWHYPYDKVYAEGVVKDKITFQKQAKFRDGCGFFPDINGQLVVTHNTFLNFWAWLRDCLKVMTLQTINCGGAGILKNEFIQVIPLKECLERKASKKLVGVDKTIKAAYEYDTRDGVIEKLLVPRFKRGVKVRWTGGK